VKTGARLQSLRDTSSFEPYLRRTIVNLATTRGRRRQAEQRAMARMSPLTPEPRGQTDIAAWEVRRAALWTLPVRQRAALVLRYYADFSEEQTADVLDCSLPAAKSLVARGLRTLRSHVTKKEWYDIAPR